MIFKQTTCFCSNNLFIKIPRIVLKYRFTYFHIVFLISLKRIKDIIISLKYWLYTQYDCSQMLVITNHFKLNKLTFPGPPTFNQALN